MPNNHFDPLPESLGEFPQRRGKFIDIETFGLRATKAFIVSGTLTDLTVTGTITGGTMVGSDIYSDNWDGTIPPSLSTEDTGASVGYAFDGSAGGAQFENIFARGGKMSSLQINGYLELNSGGLFRTDVNANDHIEMGFTSPLDIEFWEPSFNGLSPVGQISHDTITHVTKLINTTGGFSISQESWNAPTLLNSWVDFGAGHQAARYRITSDGTVQIQGLIKNGTTTAGTVIFTLPAGYRPDAQMIFIEYGAAGALKLEILANGNVVTGVGFSATNSPINCSFQI